MGMFLDNKTAYNNYKAMSRSRYFADKSAMIAELADCMENAQRYLCFTRPRRFGKSVMADMVASYFSQCCNSRDIFDGLDISKWGGYEDHINRYSVIYIDFSKTSGNCSDYNSYIERVVSGLKNDIREKYSEIDVGDDTAVWDDLERTGEQYIFVLDKWDAVFHMRFMSEDDKHDYLLFLRNLLKDNGYVRLAYMTGVLPIAKYSSGSELNMFAEYSMAVKKRFSEYFGFSEEETDRLYEKYLDYEAQPEITRDDLRIWYDGYYNARGHKMYNPRSVICALNDNQLSNYWTSSGPYDEIFYYIKNSIDDVREDIVLMLSGESVPAGIREYAATSQRLETRDEIYSAMVIYGLLTYYNGRVSIPNKEMQDTVNGICAYACYDRRTKTHSCAVEITEQ